METNAIITFIMCILAIIILGRFILPYKKILKLLINSILGGALIYIINLVGSSFNFHIGLNIITSIFVRNIRSSRSNIISNFEINNIKNIGSTLYSR